MSDVFGQIVSPDTGLSGGSIVNKVIGVSVGAIGLFGGLFIIKLIIENVHPKYSLVGLRKFKQFMKLAKVLWDTFIEGPLLRKYPSKTLQIRTVDQALDNIDHILDYKEVLDIFNFRG